MRPTLRDQRPHSLTQNVPDSIPPAAVSRCQASNADPGHARRAPLDCRGAEWASPMDDVLVDSRTVDQLDGPGFARIFEPRASQLAWFLGAGASAASNIPTGYDMIVDFKARLFSAAVGIARREIDPGDPLWAQRIETYFDGQHGLPPAGSPDEYATAFEAVYPEPADRRAYIDRNVNRGVPAFAHRVLAALISDGRVPCLFTTNFDDLVERSAAAANDLLPVQAQHRLTIGALDSADRAERCLRESSWPLLVQLHGDYRSEQLKNTREELRRQDERLRRVLVECCQRFGLVVVGYSGRDHSIMSALHDAIRRGAFPAGLFWILRPGTITLQAVTDLLQHAADAGIGVHVVESPHFDELAGDLDRQIELPPALSDHVRAARPAPRVVPVVVPPTRGGAFPVLRCSALPVLSLPESARRITLASPVTTPQMREMAKTAGIRQVVTAARGSEIAAFGADEDLLAVFASCGGRIADTVSLDPAVDSVARGLMYDALVRALARGRPLRPQLRNRGHSLIVREVDPSWEDEGAQRLRQAFGVLRDAYGEDLTGTVPDLGWRFAEGVELRLDRHLDRWWCVFEPFTWIDAPRERPDVTQAADETTPQVAARAFNPVGGDPAGDWRRERWARRYNKSWAVIIDAWAKLLAPRSPTTVRATALRDRPGIEAEFRLGRDTAWSHPAHTSATRGGRP